jgi:glycerol uptake facilitator-like aquaporin
MFSIYLLEFVGVTFLAFLISIFGKGYAHIIIGITLLLSGTLFAANCFNPVIAVAFYITNKITLTNLIYFIITELSGAIIGFLFGQHVKTYFISNL